jgi:hypothetical protein
MSARAVVKAKFMSEDMEQAAVGAAQEAIANFTTEQEIASAIKASFEQRYPST